MAKLQEYYVSVPIGSARGFQFWTVRAKSAEDAIQRIKNGGGEFADDQIEVTDLEFDNATAELNE